MFTKAGALQRYNFSSYFSFTAHSPRKPANTQFLFNTRRKKIISKTPKVTPINMIKTNELIVLL